MNTYEIILWPCGTWCFPEELSEFNKSDDYTTINVPDECEDVDQYIMENNL